VWRYKSPIGDIYIKQLSDGRYGMIYDDKVWESCHTPQAQADNVYMQVTGCFEWDDYDADDCFVPSDLSEWEKL
jgi:hypothetical protein